MSPREVVARGASLLERGEPFAAHEVFEDEWKAVRDSDRHAERDFWRGLAQAAVAAEHARRDNRVGEQRLRERAALTLAAYAGQVLYEVDAARLITVLTTGGRITLGLPG